MHALSFLIAVLKKFEVKNTFPAIVNFFTVEKKLMFNPTANLWGKNLYRV